MTVLVSTLGTSPGGVCEILRHLISRNIKIDEVVLIRTNDPKVEFAFKLVKLMIKLCVDRNIKVSDYVFEKNDIENVEDLNMFKQILTTIIERYKNRGVYVDVTGGRKVMSIVAAVECSKVAQEIYVAHIPQEAYRYISGRVEILKQRESIIDCLSKYIDQDLTLQEIAKRCGVIESVIEDIKTILCSELIREKDVSIISIPVRTDIQ